VQRKGKIRRLAIRRAVSRKFTLAHGFPERERTAGGMPVGAIPPPRGTSKEPRGEARQSQEAIRLIGSNRFGPFGINA